MSPTLKCLIEINEQKYNIIIDNNDRNGFKLSDVFNEIQKIDSKQKISFETHLFEIFDKDFDEYVILRSGQQIENLSRIRVSPKHQNDSHFKSDNQLIATKSKIKTNSLVSNNSINNETDNAIKTSLIKPELNDKLHESQSSINPFYYNYEKKNSSTKRIVDENEDNSIYNSFFKRIKKEISYVSIPIGSRTKQETDLKFSDNISEPIVNSFCQLSLSKATISSPMPSTSYQTQQINDSFDSPDISEEMKKLTVNGESTKKRKKKKKKSKKSKIKITKSVNNYKNVINKSSKKSKRNKVKPKPNIIQRIESNVIRGLKVTINESHTKEEIEKLMLLKNEGVVLKHRKKADIFKCLLCDQKFDTMLLAIDHSQSSPHLSNKSEHHFKANDCSLALNIGKYSDIEVILSRRKEMNKISNSVKQEYYSHGIRLKDGFGANAYVCLKCNVSFNSLSDVKNHLETFDRQANNSKTNEQTSFRTGCDVDLSEQGLSIEKRFKSEGIISKYRNRGKKKGTKLYCVFCEHYFNSEETAIAHLNRENHERTRRGENLSKTDHQFTVKSELADQFEFAFARISTLKSIKKEMKVKFSREGIRLKDGIGSHAFVCLTCDLPIASNSIESGSSEIEFHIKQYHQSPDQQTNKSVQVLDLNFAINKLNICSDLQDIPNCIMNKF